MTNAYCTLEDIKSSLTGDVPNMGTSHDQSLVKKILETSKDLDRMVAECRGEPDSLFSFLADQPYGQQRVYVSATPAASAGTFVLMFDGQITGPIDYDAEGQIVEDALAALSTVGEGNVAVTGFGGGPWTVDFAGDLVGPQPVISGRATMTPDSAYITVLPMIQGTLLVPSERFFRATPALYGKLLPIDDCVEVVEVKIYNGDGSMTDVLSSPSDFRLHPLRGLPIEGLKATSGDWPEEPFNVGVIARWGHRTEIPYDVREGITIETIRSHFSALAGNDDRLGMTPFGRVITSKAFTSKFHQLASDYGSKLW